MNSKNLEKQVDQLIEVHAKVCLSLAEILPQYQLMQAVMQELLEKHKDAFNKKLQTGEINPVGLMSDESFSAIMIKRDIAKSVVEFLSAGKSIGKSVVGHQHKYGKQ